ncbi:unnamed protein product [Dibothriocephalus latus]|uniref:Uncharacterized protein n=1 Tax=Dibothriocephalus latus TaxID=60516 RepID=A0A3P6UN91_DIBLA|nr:unnamed protein product [Dibothriocephalus latus]
MTGKSAGDNRQKHWSETTTSMEQALMVGYTRQFYQTIRQVNHWLEHFEYLFSFDEQPSTLSLSCKAELNPSPSYAVPCDLPSEDKGADAIQRLRNTKAAGEDGTSAEIGKYFADTLTSWLHEVVKEAWRD